MDKKKPTIRVADWNVHHHTNWRLASPTFERIFRWKPDILILQEIQNDRDGILEGLQDEHGFKSRHAEPEFAIAWDPKRFDYVRHSRTRMAPTEYWTINYSLIVVLADRELPGQHLKVMSYHAPAHVQAPNHVTHDRVMKVHREFADKRHAIATRHDIPFLSAGDSNIDPRKGWRPAGGWDFEFDRKPLTYVRAEKPTYGGRHIDEFMVVGLEPTRDRDVLDDGPSDHCPVLQEFTYGRLR